MPTEDDFTLLVHSPLLETLSHLGRECQHPLMHPSSALRPPQQSEESTLSPESEHQSSLHENVNFLHGQTAGCVCDLSLTLPVEDRAKCPIVYT